MRSRANALAWLERTELLNQREDQGHGATSHTLPVKMLPAGTPGEMLLAWIFSEEVINVYVQQTLHRNGQEYILLSRCSEYCVQSRVFWQGLTVSSKDIFRWGLQSSLEILTWGQWSKGGLQPSGGDHAAEETVGRASDWCGDAREGSGVQGLRVSEENQGRRWLPLNRGQRFTEKVCEITEGRQKTWLEWGKELGATEKYYSHLGGTSDLTLTRLW